MSTIIHDTENTKAASGSGVTCEIVQDLLPSYIDGLVSAGTAAVIEEHIGTCSECRAVLDSMRADEEAAYTPDERDRTEIDFLRKSRRRGKRAVVLGIVAALLVAGAAAGAKLYLIGSEYRGDMGCDLMVNGSEMTVGVTAADSIHVIRDLDFTMDEGGIVTGTVRAVLPGIYHSSGTFAEEPADDADTSMQIATCDFSESFSFDEEIREVRIGDRIIWAGGRDVSEKVSEVYLAGHEYIGDASGNGALLTALGITEDLGNLYSELQTGKEPYVWTIIFDDDQTKYNPEYLRQRLEGYGYILIATVGNLGEVDFRYTADGEEVVLSVTEKDADKFFGGSIKTCRSDAGALAELMEKCGID